MNREQCIQQLAFTFETNPGLQDNISQLMNRARESSKETCLEFFDFSISRVKIVVESFDWTIPPEPGPLPEVVADTGATHAAPDVIEWATSWMASMNAWSMEWLLKRVWLFVGWIVLILIIRYLIKYLSRFFYDVLNAHRIMYMKVILPRGDSKSDRDQQKEIAKDMNEKIGRMTQVFTNLHKLGELSVSEKILYTFFDKPKVTLILHFEKWQLYFVVGTYPEYKDILEGAISAQYADASIETIPKPRMFSKKHYEIIPMQPEKDSVYPIRVFKQSPDDPLNNVIDSIGKVPRKDTFSIVIPIKPVGDGFNKKAKAFADALYKQDDSAVESVARWKYLLMPWKFIGFLVKWPSESLLSKWGDKWWGYVRMVKAEEDALNVIGEEATYQAFKSGILIISSSDSKQECTDNVYNMIGTFNVYTHEYNNWLDHPERLSDVFGSIMKPLWKFAAMFHLPSFFFKHNIFSVNELTSLFHFPDGIYNRAPIIEWAEYKTLAPPDNLPEFKEDNGYVMSGIVAESFKKWKISEILKDYEGDRSVGEKIVEEKELFPIEKFTQKQLEWKEIIEQDGKKMVEWIKKKKVRGYKLYKDWVLLWVNIYRNSFKPVYMKRDDRTRHHYVIGKSGTGKSVYLQFLARQDVWNGDGICLIDPHGDLAEEMLEYIPKERAKDVIYFDAGNEDRPMGLNLYEINSVDEADRTVNDATEMFIKMFGPEIFGPRIQEYFKFGSLTLLEDFEDRPTILDVPRLFTDDAFREYKTKKVKNPVVKNFWEKTYNSMGDREKQEIIPYFTSKFVSFNTNRLIRNIIWQTKSAFTFEDVMNNQKILLINLSKGKIGEMNAQLLGMIIVSKIYNAAMARQNIAKKDRKDFYLYVDEFQNFVTDTFADILSEARKYRLNLVMAHQYIAQLDSNAGSNIGEGKSKVRDAVFGNVWTMQSFKIGANDAEFMEKEYAPVLGAQDIVWIANYKTYTKLNIDNSTTRVFSMNSIFSKDYRNKKIAWILQEYSAKKYGRKREFVDAEIEARLGISVDESALDWLDAASWDWSENLTVDTDENNVEVPGTQDIANKQTVQKITPADKSSDDLVEEKPSQEDWA